MDLRRAPGDIQALDVDSAHADTLVLAKRLVVDTPPRSGLYSSDPGGRAGSRPWTQLPWWAAQQSRIYPADR